MATRLFLPVLVSFAVGACSTTTVVGDKERAKAKIHYDMGITHMNQGDLRGALRDLLAATELDDQLEVAHNALGLVYHGLGMLDEALGHYEQAVTIQPKFSEAHNNMGILLIDLGRYDDAIAAFKLALSEILYATPSLAEGNLGWAHYRKGDVEQGMRHLRNAVATNPKFCRGYLWLARIGLDQGKPEAVKGHHERFERHCVGDDKLAGMISPEHVREMGYYLAVGFIEQGESDAARTALSKCADREASFGFGLKCAESLATLE